MGVDLGVLRGMLTLNLRFVYISVASLVLGQVQSIAYSATNVRVIIGSIGVAGGCKA